MIISIRAIIIRSLSTRITTKDVLPNHNYCVIHFLDAKNFNLSKEYLKLAWSEGSIGANHLYLVNMREMNIAGLNFSELYDFKRLILAVSDGVGIVMYSAVQCSIIMMYHYCSKTLSRSSARMNSQKVKELSLQ